MADDEKAKPRLEIAHVLFIDIVGYSKLLTDEQSEALQELNQIVRNTEAAREAQAAGQLIILPTGDGMAMVFTGSVEGPAECALEVSQALRAPPSLPGRLAIPRLRRASPAYDALRLASQRAKDFLRLRARSLSWRRCSSYLPLCQ